MQIELINQNMSAPFNCNNCVPMRQHMLLTEMYIYIYIYIYIERERERERERYI